MNEKTCDGATTALHRRIEELTAERASLRELTVELQRQLDAWLATTWQTPEQALGCIASWKAEEESWAEESAQLRASLATERAAREQAEKDRDDAVKACDDNWVTHQRIVQAERERDTALARVKKLERAMKERDADNLALNAEVEAAETALASARILIEQAADGEHEWSPKFRGECVSWITSHPAPVAAESEPRYGYPAGRDDLRVDDPIAALPELNAHDVPPGENDPGLPEGTPR